MTHHTWFLDEGRNAGEGVGWCQSHTSKLLESFLLWFFFFFFIGAVKFRSTYENLIDGQSASFSTSEYLQMISKSKHASVTERFNLMLYKFQRRAKLETQVWLSGLVRMIKIYETADLNPWRPGVLSTLGLQL